MSAQRTETLSAGWDIRKAKCIWRVLQRQRQVQSKESWLIQENLFNRGLHGLKGFKFVLRNFGTYGSN
jgi:hypothetical protein